MAIFDNNPESIGRTPLVKINKITSGSKATVLAKIESRNPTFSVKCRIGAAMIWDAEEKGILGPGKSVIEPTSGNTGIALSYVCASKGYPLLLTMPDTMSIERRKVLVALGADIVLTDGAKGMKGAIEKAEEIMASDPDKYFMPQQFENPANPRIHEDTTGPEIWNDTKGEVHALVSGVGTGGTITGVSRFIKKVKKQELLSVAVEPEESPVLSQVRQGLEPSPGKHKIQGIGAGFVPNVLELDLVDRVEKVSSEEAMEFARRLAREEGILSGISSGAAMAAAYRLAMEPAMESKTIVVILPDSGERYLSTDLFS